MKNNKKGFTLAELLIVIAIMAILIAIAIPVFSAQLEKARHSVDDSVARSAKSLAESHYLLEHGDGTNTDSGKITLEFGQDKQENLIITKCTGTADNTTTEKLVDGLTPADFTPVTAKCTCGKRDTTKGESVPNGVLTVEVNSGVVKAIWTAPTSP